MNILMWVSWYSPYHAEVMEAGVFHYEQSVALQKYCNMALYYPYGLDLERNFTKEVEKGLLTYRRKKMPGNAILNFLHMAKDFMKIKKEFHPDIIHAHVALPAGKTAVILGKIFKIPVVVTEHNAIELSNLDSQKIKKWTGIVYENSSANVCVSMDSKTRLQALFPNAKFQVIYNGILNPCDVTPDKVIYRKEGYINCCIIASFYSKEVKGYQYLLPAIKELVTQGYPVLLHICGGGKYYDYYAEEVKRLNIENNVTFYGQCDKRKVYSILNQMDFSISASIFECSGVSVQEAMLLGKPLVVTRSGGANSLVTEKTAIVVDRESTQALVTGIKEMIEKKELFDTDEIKKYAFDQFEINMVTERYLKLYRSLLEKNE